MGRPVTRTASLSAKDKAQVKHDFGSVMHAYRVLMPGGLPLSWAVFRVVASGGKVTPRDLQLFLDVWQDWRQRTLRRP